MNEKELTQYIDNLVNQLKLPYFDVIVMQDHKELYRHHINATGKEHLEMWSMSKPITATAMLKLIEEGKAKLSDPISKYIPNFKNAYMLDEAGNKKPLSREITIEDCLSMRSGLDYNPQRPALVKLREKGDVPTPEVIASLADDPMLFEPGTKFKYSFSMDVIGGVIEVITKQKFSEYIKHAIFEPLHMDNSTFNPNDWDDFNPMPSYYNENGTLVKAGSMYKLFSFNKKFESAGGNLLSTVEDYAKLADALACTSKEDHPLINIDTLNNMKTIRAYDIDLVSPYTFNENGYVYGYALGVRSRISPTDYGVPQGEFGWDGAAGSYCLMDNDHQLSIVIGMMVHGWPTYIKTLHGDIAKQVYKTFINK